jgi:hypothetical protein
MKHIPLILLFVLLRLFTSGQHFCGFDEHRDFLKSHHKVNSAQEEMMNQAILEKILQRQKSRMADEEDNLVIPCVVHIIHQNGEENIPDQQVLDGIDMLNDALSNSGFFYDPEGTDLGVRVCLAQRDPEGIFSIGINRVENELTNVLFPLQDADLKSIIQWDPELYLNFWIVKSIILEENNTGVLGYSSFPDAHGTESDGIVVESDYFGSGENNSKVVLHELGHYLGLYHTFQNGCTNDNCLEDGDKVCDTPPDSHVFTIVCFDGTNSCSSDDDDTSENNPFRPIGLGGLGDQSDMQENYMDYSNLYCFRRFTPGQKERTLAALATSRFSLFGGDQCVPPCENPFFGEILVSTNTIQAGENLVFINNSNGYDEINWTINELSVSSEANFTFTENVQGHYEVSVTMENESPGCYQTFEFNIEVVCPVEVQISSNVTSTPLNGSISFESNTINATSFNWFMDDELVSESPELEYNFQELGGHTVYLLVSNEICSVQSNLLHLSVGTCTSGRENSIWNFFNHVENSSGFDFNSGNWQIQNQNNTPPGSNHCKTTICDEAGNMLFTSNGVGVFDSNLNLLPNGGNILGHTSASYGNLFMKKPGSLSEYYLFTSDAHENNYALGLRYSIIDKNLNNGLGDVTEIKNELIELTQAENFACIQHCNAKDFWLVFADLGENVFKAYLVDENGISSIPVVTPITDLFGESAWYYRIVVSPKGDQIGHMDDIYNFDAENGIFEHFCTFPISEPYIPWSSAFSPNGKKYYLIRSFNILTDICQYDISLDIEDIEGSVNCFENLDTQYTVMGFERGPDGRLFIEHLLTGAITTIENPNGQWENTNFQFEAIETQSFINNFGQFFHGYISGQTIWIEGEDQVCSGESKIYSIYGQQCLEEEINWEVIGNSSFTVNENGIEINFADESNLTLVATMATDCGPTSDTLHISISSTPELDLGPNSYLCNGQSIILDAGSGWETYTWQDNSTEQTFEVNQPGTYSVETQFGSCTLIDELVVEGFAQEINLGPDFDMCEGEVVVLQVNEYLDPMWQDGTVSNTYTIYEGGTYYVTATLPCFSTDTVFVDDCGQTLSIEEFNTGELVVYPNPAEDLVRITWGNVDLNLTKIEMFDVQGKLVWDEKISRKQKFVEINVSEYSRSTYFLKVTGENYTTVVNLVLIE